CVFQVTSLMIRALAGIGWASAGRQSRRLPGSLERALEDLVVVQRAQQQLQVVDVRRAGELRHGLGHSSLLVRRNRFIARVRVSASSQ
ncbi:MAG TPA: hypothetical protein VFZ28_14625, partial [Burkholderiaceae bacterium]|nr:hypothetical protein [Burkholderiaceae bacterium]